jgi:chromosome segregation ATPase
MKTAASAQDLTVSNTEQALTSLPSSAQQQIEALRAAIDVRLAALDAVLADPTRGESLETLILDLARLATEEARAVTTRVCVGIKLEADNELAQVRKSAQQSLEHERIVTSDFRRSLEQAEQRSATLEREKQTELRTLREQFEAKLANDRTAVDALERSAAALEMSVAEARTQIAAERTKADALAEDIRRAETRTAELVREHDQISQALAQAEAATRHERQQLADSVKAHAETQADLAAERATVAELRGAIERGRGQASTVERDREDLKNTRAAMEAELARERQIAGELERRLRDSEQALETERTAATELRQAIARAEDHAVAVGREHTEAQANSKSIAAALERERQAVADLHRAQEGLKTQVDAERQLTRELRGTLTTLEQQLADATKDAGLQAAGQDELREALLAARGGAQKLDDDLQAERAAAKTVRARLDQLEARTSRADKDAAQHVAVQEELRQALQTARNERQRLATQIDAEQAIAAELRGRLDQLGQQVVSANTDAAALNATRQALAGAEANAEQLRRELTTEQTSARDLRQEIERLNGQLAQASNQATTQDELRQSLTAANSEAQRARTELDTEREAARTAADELRKQLQTALSDSGTLRDQLDVERSSTQQLKQRLDDLESRLSRAADETVQHAAGSGELRAAVLEARADAARARAELEAERAQRRMLEEDVQRSTEAAATAADKLERQRATQDSLEQTLAASLIEHEKLVLQLDTERARIHDLERAHASADTSWREAEERLEAATRERDRPTAALETGAATKPTSSKAAAPASAAKAHAVTPPTPVAGEGSKGRSAPAAAKPATAAYALNDEGWTQVRMSTRYGFREKIEIQVNSGSGWLSDLSLGGCQLLSRTALKPKQSLKITLPHGEKGLLCTGKVIWARLEPPAAGQPLSYRGGVQFSNADQSAIEAFLARHGVDL